MKKAIKTISVALCLTLVMSVTAFAEPGFAYEDEVLTEFSPLWSQIQADDTVISVTPGSTVGELRFAWLSSSADSNPGFKVSENSNMSDAEELDVISADAIESLRSNKVTVTGLEEGKTYYYSYTENGAWSEAQPFTVQWLMILPFFIFPMLKSDVPATKHLKKYLFKIPVAGTIQLRKCLQLTQMPLLQFQAVTSFNQLTASFR